MDWETILLAVLAGSVVTVPVSIAKSIPSVAAVLKALPWPWAAKVALALASTGTAGAKVAGIPDNGSSQVGFLAGALAGAVAYEVWDKLGLEKVWRSLGARVSVGIKPPEA